MFPAFWDFCNKTSWDILELKVMLSRINKIQLRVKFSIFERGKCQIDPWDSGFPSISEPQMSICKISIVSTQNAN